MVCSVDVAVKEDKVHGSLATITVKPASHASAEEVKGRVDNILTRYTVKYSVELV